MMYEKGWFSSFDVFGDNLYTLTVWRILAIKGDVHNTWYSADLIKQQKIYRTMSID